MPWHFIGYILACLTLPIVWGFIVHRVFEWLQKVMKRPSSANDPRFPDFQI